MLFMGLLDKLKNVFFEEEYVEVEEKEKPKKPEKVKKTEVPEKAPEEEVVAKKIETPRREERHIDLIEPDDTEVLNDEEPVKNDPANLSDQELLKPDASFKLFEDDDFVEEAPKEEPTKVEIPSDPASVPTKKEPYGGAYQTNFNKVYREEPKEKTFHPTPIISPIYGVLDKNYSKEDIVDKKERQRTASSYVHKVDLDTVREKAYGLSTPEKDAPKKEETPISHPVDNLLYDMSDRDSTPSVPQVTIADAEEYFEDLGLEYNVDYKDQAKEKASSHTSEAPISSDIDDLPSKVTVPSDEEEKKDDQSIEDNLFDLIDSMYEEKE